MRELTVIKLHTSQSALSHAVSLSLDIGGAHSAGSQSATIQHSALALSRSSNSELRLLSSLCWLQVSYLTICVHLFVFLDQDVCTFK
jgi:hypothetical protein